MLKTEKNPVSTISVSTASAELRDRSQFYKAYAPFYGYNRPAPDLGSIGHWCCRGCWRREAPLRRIKAFSETILRD